MRKPKIKIPDQKQVVDYMMHRPFIRRLLEWAKTHSLPGFFKVPIYEVVIFVYNEVRSFDLFTRANSIAFTFFLSLFPALLSLFTLLPFLQQYFLRFMPQGESFEEYLREEIGRIMPGSAGQTLLDFVVEITTKPKIGLLSFGFILAAYFASNGMLSMMRSFEKSYKTTFRQRSGFKMRIIALLLTGLLGGLVIGSVILVILGNVILEWLSMLITIDGFTAVGFELLRWISIIFLFYFGISIIYRYGAATYKRFHIFSPGATLATILSLLSSLAFSLYIDEFERYETYDKFYGSIAAIIIVMLWIQLNSLILLIGFELNASIAINRDLKLAREQEE